MLGVTSVNRCRACDRVHRRWGRVVGVRFDGPEGLRADETTAYAYGQAMASRGPGLAHPDGLSRRHGRELEAAAITMELANLAGNRFLPIPSDKSSVGRRAAMETLIYDIIMRLADRAGIPVRHPAVHEVATRASPPGCRSRSRGARCSSTVVGLVFAPAIENGLLTVTRPSPYDGWGFNRPTG